MKIKNILKTLSEIDPFNEVIDIGLVDSLEDIERSASNLRNLLINVRVKKIMSTFEQNSTDVLPMATDNKMSRFY